MAAHALKSCNDRYIMILGSLVAWCLDSDLSLYIVPAIYKATLAVNVALIEHAFVSLFKRLYITTLWVSFIVYILCSL